MAPSLQDVSKWTRHLLRQIVLGMLHTPHLLLCHHTNIDGVCCQGMLLKMIWRHEAQAA